MQTRQKIDRLLSQLEAAGKRSTPQRHAVCQALIEHGGHPTVAEVFERVRTIFPMISQATVYNTIDTLEELGLIQRLDIANHEHTHYDLEPSIHVNIVCTHCGRIHDVHMEALNTLLRQVNQHTGYEISLRSGVVVYGICPDCHTQSSYDQHVTRSGYGKPAEPGHSPATSSDDPAAASRHLGTSSHAARTARSRTRKKRSTSL